MSSKVSTATNLFDYFNRHVETVRAKNGVEISNDTSLYLANLLADRARTDRPEPPEQTFAELHARAVHAPPAAQVRTYREMGDRALYVLGFFAESLSRRIVAPDYYADMGAAAYHRVDILFKALFADAFGPVFRELAHDFRACVGLIAEVRDEQRREVGDDLLRIYEVWLQTGDEALAARLRTHGLILPSSALGEG